MKADTRVCPYGGGLGHLQTNKPYVELSYHKYAKRDAANTP